MTLCRHCQIRKACRPRGLCFPCYETLAIRQQYPSESKFCPIHPSRSPDTETMADLERMIAEQLPTMPGRVGEDVPTDEPKLPGIRVFGIHQRGRRVDRRRGNN